MTRYEDIDLSRYSDSPWDRSTDVAVSLLTDEGVLQGNDDGTYRPDRRLNRAEFMEIVMRLLPSGGTNVALNCFPDVSRDAWYAQAVCRAKAAGIVRGNAVVGVDEAQWKFEPARDVQYEEAVKVLVKLYALPVVGDEEGADWYVPFIEVADDENLSVTGLEPGDRITRGEMARLTVAFFAESRGELDLLRSAEGRSSSVSSRSSSRSSSSRSSSRSSLSSSRSSTSSSSSSSTGTQQGAIQSSILLLGEETPLLAGVQFFSNNEPVQVTRITVELANDSESVESFIVEREDGTVLGTASQVGSDGTTYRLSLAGNDFELPRRENVRLYFGARLKQQDSGGVSGEDIQVSSVTLEGNGGWSNDSYTTSSNDTFSMFQTARAAITGVANDGDLTAAISSGTDQLLAEFRFTGVSNDTQADPRVTGLQIRSQQTGNVTLSNVELRVEGGDVSHECTISSSVISCTNIPASIGSIDDTKTIRVYGDVTVPSDSTNPSLQLVLNNPGTPSETGDVTWTDGTTTFTWLGLDTPIVRGTRFD